MRWKQGVFSAVENNSNSQCSSHMGFFSIAWVYHASSHLSRCKMCYHPSVSPKLILHCSPLLSPVHWIRNPVIDFLWNRPEIYFFFFLHSHHHRTSQRPYFTAGYYVSDQEALHPAFSSRMSLPHPLQHSHYGPLFPRPIFKSYYSLAEKSGVDS